VSGDLLSHSLSQQQQQHDYPTGSWDAGSSGQWKARGGGGNTSRSLQEDNSGSLPGGSGGTRRRAVRSLRRPSLSRITTDSRRKQKLVLSHRGLSEVPYKLLRKSSNLNALHLNNNVILELEPEPLAKLLQRSNLSSTLHTLHLAHNRLSGLPSEIVLLRNLRVLTLQYNQISELPCTLGLLSQLQRLDVSWNRLRTLPVELLQLHALKYLNVEGNPIREPPLEVCLAGLSAIRARLQALQRNPVHEPLDTSEILVRIQTTPTNYSPQHQVRLAPKEELMLERLAEERRTNSKRAAFATEDIPDDLSVERAQNEKKLSRTRSRSFDFDSIIKRVTVTEEDLENVLSDEQSFKEYQKFLQGEFSEENLLFWKAIHTLFESTDDATLYDSMWRIYDDFLHRDGMYEVNLTAKERQPLLDLFAGLDRLANPSTVDRSVCIERFQSARRAVFRQMLSDSFPRFCKRARDARTSGQRRSLQVHYPLVEKF